LLVAAIRASLARMKTALITGGAKGIGRGIAQDLATRGWNVAIGYLTSEAEAREAAEAATRAGARAIAVRADVGDPAAVGAMVARVEAELGAPDALVHCVGPYHRVDLLKETPEGWRTMFAQNLDSFFLCARAVAPKMIEKKWGRIVAFSMANAERAAANANVTAHYIAKLGVVVLARTLAKQLAPHGITVNTIAPGFIASGSAPDEELAKMVKNIPAGYVGKVDDAVAAARFLLSDEASYVTGSNLVLSGGWGL
jgi:3-oxoacyl-[acyl-carrier protein] reductase